MLFYSQAENFVSTLFKSHTLNFNSARKQEARRRLAFYHDEQIDYLNEKLTQFFSEPDRLTPTFFNVVKKIINQLALLYAKDAIREVDGAQADNEIFTEIVRSTKLPVKMKIASRYTKLLKTILLRPVWRKGRMDLDILTGDILDVSYGDTPEDLQAVIITHFPESGKSNEVEYSLWAPEQWQRLDYNGNVIKIEDNPYGLLPFVPLWDRHPLGDFWIPGGDDLINAQEAINEKLTDLMYTIRQQGFGVGWIKKGKKGGGILHVDPGSLIELPEDGSIGFESQKAPIKDILEAIDFIVKQAAVMNGLSVSSLSTKTVRESGVAKVQGARELEEQRRDDIILFSEYEHQLFDMFRVVWNVHNPSRKISDKANFKINFDDPKPTISPKDQAETYELFFKLGLKSPVDAILEIDPDIKTREEAISKLERIRQEIQTFMGSTEKQV